MGYYVSQQLRKGEAVVYNAKVHWVVYIFPVVILYFGVPAMFTTKTFQDDITTAIGPVVTTIGILLLINAIIRQFCTELAITDERVIAKFGLISRSTFEQQLDRVEGVNLNQSIFGRLLNYGTVTVRGVGGGLTPIPYINEPQAFQTAPSELLSNIDD